MSDPPTESVFAGVDEPDLTDQDNPEWTLEDFAHAVGPEALSDAELAAFPRTRGRPPLVKPKQPVSLRLDAGTVRHLRGLGAGWQTRVNQALAGLIRRGEL